MENKIILTISMLVSNRPETIEKSLKSLEKLRKNVSSELILVDTGCGEAVRSIIEKYADKIVEFKWCNDFSKARNAGLKKASGEWFLYLDDDEWFEETKEIEDFFKSKEYKNYSMADYIVRNYENLNGTVYSDSVVRRMTRIETYTQFNYPIHEILTIVPGKIKTFNSYVHHYGYIYKTKQEHYKHSQRNLIPLLGEVEKEPYNLHHHIQIAQEYNGINEHYKSIEISLKGIEDFNPEKTPDLYLNALMINVVECYLKVFQYENALKYAEEYWKNNFLSQLGKAKLCNLLSKIYYELRNYEKIIPYVQMYEEMYETRLEKADLYNEQKTIFLYDTFDERVAASTFCIGVQAAIKIKETEEIQHYFNRIDFNKKVLMLEQDLLELICQEFMNSDDEIYTEMLNKLLTRKELENTIIILLEKQKRKNKSFILRPGNRWEKIKQDNWYFDYLKLITSENSSRRKELFDEIWKEPNMILTGSVEYELWDIAWEEQIDMYKIITAIPYYKWNQASLDACNKMHWIKLSELNTKISYTSRDEGKYPHFLFWNICFIERKIKQIENLGEIDVESLFHEYAEQVEDYYKMFYNNEIMEEHPEFMPANYQVAVCIEKAQKYIKLSDYKSAVEQLKKIRELCPDFSQAVKQCLQTVEKLMKQKEKEDNEIKDEMAHLARTLKLKIRALIDQNYYEQALQIIQQLENFVGEDEELKQLKEQALLK